VKATKVAVLMVVVFGMAVAVCVRPLGAQETADTQKMLEEMRRAEAERGQQARRMELERLKALHRQPGPFPEARKALEEELARLQTQLKQAETPLSGIRLTGSLPGQASAAKVSAGTFRDGCRRGTELLKAKVHDKGIEAAPDAWRLGNWDRRKLADPRERTAVAKEFALASEMVAVVTSPKAAVTHLHRIDFSPDGVKVSADASRADRPRLEPYFDCYPFVLEVSLPLDRCGRLLESMATAPPGVRVHLNSVGVSAAGADASEGLSWSSDNPVRLRVDGWALDHNPPAPDASSKPAAKTGKDAGDELDRQIAAERRKLEERKGRLARLRKQRGDVRERLHICTAVQKRTPAWWGPTFAEMTRRFASLGVVKKDLCIPRIVLGRVDFDTAAGLLGEGATMRMSSGVAPGGAALRLESKFLAALQLDAARYRRQATSGTRRTDAADTMYVVMEGTTQNPMRGVFITRNLVDKLTNTWLCRRCNKPTKSVAPPLRCRSGGCLGETRDFEPVGKPLLADVRYVLDMIEQRFVDRQGRLLRAADLPDDGARTYAAILKREKDFEDRVIQDWAEGDEKDAKPLPTRRQFLARLEREKGIRLAEITTFQIALFLDPSGELLVEVARLGKPAP